MTFSTAAPSVSCQGAVPFSSSFLLSDPCLEKFKEVFKRFKSRLHKDSLDSLMVLHVVFKLKGTWLLENVWSFPAGSNGR